MRNLFEAISPFKFTMGLGLMDMSHGFHQKQEQKIKITKETPVLDSLGIILF